MGSSNFLLTLVFSILLSLGNSNGFLLENKTNKINKTSDEFLTIQLQAIKSYQKMKPVKNLSCSYQDQLEALSFIPVATAFQQTLFSDLIKKSLNGTGLKLIRGASAVAQVQKENMEVILVWEGVMINSVEYYNVLYGGSKYFHIGIGLPFPDSYYGMHTEDLRFYDLKSCVPFTEWVTNTMDHRVKEIFLMPKDSHKEIRNAVNGIAALLQEKMNATEMHNFFLTTTMDPTTESTMSSKSNVSLTED